MSRLILLHFIALALLALICLPRVAAEDVFGPPSDDADEAPQPAAAEPEEQAQRQLSNRFFVEMAQAWASEVGMPVRMVGNGSFRVMLIGRMPGDLDPETMVAAGEQALLGLDTWTGRNDQLPVKDLAADRAGVVALIPSNRDFDRWLRWAREREPRLRHSGEGADLAAQLRSFTTPRFSLRSIEAIQVSRSIHYAVYTATNQAIDTWFIENGGHPVPTWLREGLNAEMQRLIPPGDPRVLFLTISYENSGGGQAATDWAVTLAEAINTRDSSLLRIYDLLSIEPISLPMVQYIQMWSFSKFLVSTARNQRGERNKFQQMLNELAAGEGAISAIETAYRIKYTRLDRAWGGWATSQRR